MKLWESREISIFLHFLENVQKEKKGKIDKSKPEINLSPTPLSFSLGCPAMYNCGGRQSLVDYLEMAFRRLSVTLREWEKNSLIAARGFRLAALGRTPPVLGGIVVIAEGESQGNAPRVI